MLRKFEGISMTPVKLFLSEIRMRPFVPLLTGRQSSLESNRQLHGC